jgi:hypothetical protein
VNLWGCLGMGWVERKVGEVGWLLGNWLLLLDWNVAAGFDGDLEAHR